jgi:hypothetical protein
MSEHQLTTNKWEVTINPQRTGSEGIEHQVVAVEAVITGTEAG